jgi:glycosyltransferase involved in cell wall biosynthesis
MERDYARANDSAARLEAEWLRFEPASDGSLAVAAGAAPDAGGSEASALSDGALVVRGDAFDDAGGFAEGVRAGAELDLLLRLRELGRTVGRLPEPPASAALWLSRRHGARRPRSPLGLLRAFADNRTRRRRRLPTRAGDRSAVVFTDAYPARSETFVYREVEALSKLGWSVRVEASARPGRIERGAARATRVDWLEDDPPLRALADLLRLAARHPLRCLADLRDRRRWAREERPWPLRSLASAARRLAAGGERHVHVHFAAGAALHAMRLARITGITWSVVGHGYDVFAKPRNLPEKLASAAFSVAPCEYTARHLRSLMPPGREADVVVVVMGVDGDEFRRSRPAPANGTVAAIGRLVEKKGFGDLIEAVATLPGETVSRLVIAGDGPLRSRLENAIRSRGLEGRAQIISAWGAAPVRALLEGADLLAMPSVVASDGDRDAMPVVVKEALALEIPVVATNEVGLPELVRGEWGRLVAPRDPGALAEAIAGLLSLAPADRAEMGAAGREHVLAHCDVTAETQKLAARIEIEITRRARR